MAYIAHKAKTPSVFMTTLPAFALVLGLVALVAGGVAMEQSMQDYRTPVFAGADGSDGGR